MADATGGRMMNVYGKGGTREIGWRAQGWTARLVQRQRLLQLRL